MSEEVVVKSLERFNIREKSKLKLFEPTGLIPQSVRDSSQRSDNQKYTKINSPTLVKGMQSTKSKNMQ